MCFSRKRKSSAPLAWEQVKALMDKYGVDEAEIDTCWERFNELDGRGTGFLGRQDILFGLDQPVMYVTEFFFDAIGFKEDLKMKVETLYEPIFTVVTLTRAKIIRIMFDQMDIENAGWISNDEIELRVCKFCGVTRYDEVRQNIRDCISDADADKNGRIQSSEFVALVGKLPRMFHPVFKMQAALQQFTLGKNVWERKMELAVLRERERQAELRRLRAEADAIAAGEVPTTIVDNSLDNLPDPSTKQAAPDTDGDGDGGGADGGGSGSKDDEEGDETKTWKQRERDRADAEALGGQWKDRRAGGGDDDDDGGGDQRTARNAAGAAGAGNGEQSGGSTGNNTTSVQAVAAARKVCVCASAV